MIHYSVKTNIGYTRLLYCRAVW